MSLAKLVGKRKLDFRQRVVILEGFGRRADTASLEAIVDALDARTTPVQIAAVQAAKERKAAEPIGPLIDLLEKHWKRRDRIFLETALALTSLTGKNFEAIADWRKFWKTAQDGFDPKKIGEKTAAGRSIVALQAPEDALAFFGTEIFST